MEKKQEIKEQTEEILHTIEPTNKSSLFSMKTIVFLIFIALLGVGTGYFLATNKAKITSTTQTATTTNGGTIEKGAVFGSDDIKTFSDIVEGVLKEGGIDGEGQYHLVRSGGDSQNVYVTSSIVDLSKFINKKIKVWGQTQKAQKAGWLMDVGRVEVLE
ncbi:MAG: hypothetical protein Q8P10_02965 [bacterium]|nr:hypothetical protein [bacterium]